MAKLSTAELKTIVASYVTSSYISNATYTATRNNTASLLDEIAKKFTLDTNFTDKLAIFDGEALQFGKDLEEWQEDLILPASYDDQGSNNNAPQAATYRPNFYSKSLGRKTFKATIYNNDIERCVNNASEFASVIAMKTKRLFDSEAVFKYDAKRQILADAIALCEAVKTSASSYSASSSYTVGTYLKDSTEYGIVVKAITGSATATATWAKCKENGYVILLDLEQTITIPTTEATGEAFIVQVKKDIEVATDYSEGHSLNGNTLGAANGLLLLVKQGVMPEVDVKVMAGAFHQENLMLPEANIITVKDFGNNATNVYAMLIDARAVKLHNSYRAVREHENADGDFINYVLHCEYTGHFSRNVFVKIYKTA